MLSTVSHFHPCLILTCKAISLPLEGAPLRGSSFLVDSSLACKYFATVSNFHPSKIFTGKAGVYQKSRASYRTLQ
jgi:hypothetical protein